MRIFTADCNVDLVYLTLPAMTRVVVPDGVAMAARKDVHKAGQRCRISGLGHYSRPYCGQPLGRGQKLLVWRGHGVGDQLVAAGICAAIEGLHPQAEILFAGHPGLWRALWKDVPNLPFSPIPEPIPWNVWTGVDYHLILEDMCECDLEADQHCTWDGMLGHAGLLARVDPSHRRPYVPVTDPDREAAAEWLRTVCRLPATAPLVLWQVASSSKIRSLAYDVTAAQVAEFAGRRPDVQVLVTGAGSQVAAFGACAGAEMPPNVAWATPPRLRIFFAAVESADVVVGPDSMALHAAAGLGTPSVGLWASFHPDDRAKYYPGHAPLYRPLPCSPCRAHECGDQPEGCPLYPGEYCRALAAIRPAEVADAVTAQLPPPETSTRNQHPQRKDP